MSLPPDLKIAHPNRFGGRWVEGKTNGMNYYQAARGKDLCQDRARMKLALAATPCLVQTPGKQRATEAPRRSVSDVLA